MKFTGFVAAAAFASGAVAWTSESGWATTTSSTTSATTTGWAKSTTTSKSSSTTTTTTASTEWGPWSTTTTTTPSASTTWEDWTSSTPVSYTTSVVTAITTYCPSATQIVHGGKTYTVSSATTLTITDCPCTLSYPVWTSTTTSCSTTATAATVAPVAPVSSSAWASGAASPSASVAAYNATTPALSTYTGAASANKISGALAGMVGVAVILL